MTDLPEEVDDIPNDGLTEKQRRFVWAWFRLHEENELAGNPDSERDIANKAAAEAGYSIATKDNYGWVLTKNPKIALAIHEVGHKEMVRLRIKAVRILDRVLDQVTPTTAAGLLKLAFEHGAFGTHEKGSKLTVDSQVTVTGDALNNELVAALARRGIGVVDGGKLEPIENKSEDSVKLPAVMSKYDKRREADENGYPKLKPNVGRKPMGPKPKMRLTPPEYTPMRGKWGKPGRPPTQERIKFTFEEDL